MKNTKVVMKLNFILIWMCNQNLTESDFSNIDVKFQFEHQIQIQETKDSGWIFDKNIWMRLRVFITDQLIGSSYFKNPLRSNAILKLINIASFGLKLPNLILVKIVIRKEYKITDKISLN